MLYNNICTSAPMKVENPTTAGISTEVKGAAPLVPVGDALAPVVEPVLVAVLCTFVLPEAQKYAPLITLELASCWKGSQLMFPELCMLNVPLQSARAGKVTVEKFPDMLIAPVVFKEEKPSIVIKALLLAMVTPPPTVTNAGKEILVNSALAMSARSPPTEVRLGAMTEVK